MAFDGGGGLSVASNDVTESCAVGRDREEGEAWSTVKEERKGVRKAKLTGGGEDDGALARFH
jgi:hypothetical protein